MFYGMDKNVIRMKEIKKSKFITYLFSVTTISQVKDILDQLHIEHKKATHICYAYRLTNPCYEKASDDGEPSGTAGIPMLDVLKKKNIQNILAIVVRYFGGIKLGAGGLVRAYSSSVVEALEQSAIVPMEIVHVYQIECTFSTYQECLQRIHAIAHKVEIQYGQNVIVQFYSNLTKEEIEIETGYQVQYQKDEVCQIG